MPEQPQYDEIFLAALDLPEGSARKQYLDQACGANSELRQRVERLLRAQPHVEGFLESAAAPNLAAFAPTVNEPSLPEKPGAQIGPYKLLEQIGEGGFGIVFMAEQQHPVRRMVALKVLKPGMDTRQVVARFEAERQALALMDHPHIAKVFDAGATDSGRPYFVMELVKGIPITQFCDSQQLTPRERLELFVTVCQAVQHAHQKAIIHRDIKPSNVLVSKHDVTPVVKVIDFGVAKALGQKLTDKTLFTGFAQMIGTPLYMSPEQAELSGLDIDTRSDIYSLGVLLYELLTGTTPFDKELLKSAAFDEIRRIIREDEPPKPSTRLSELSRSNESSRTSGKQDAADHAGPARQTGPTSLASVAALRKTAPRRLSQLMRGDLDWIVMKSLDKDRQRRYETANDLAADVERFLVDEPVLASPPSRLYRFLKFARRNRKAIGAAGMVAAALLVAAIATVFSIVNIYRHEAIVAEEQAKVADEKSEAADMLAQESRRESALQTLQRIRLTTHRAGWSRETLRLAKQAADIRRDDHLRDQTIACLVGLDANKFKEWQFGATSVAFNADGKHLLMGGLDKGPRLWNAATDTLDEPLPAAAGATCFAASGNGLVWTSETPWSFALWNVSQRKLLQRMEVPLPDGVDEPNDAVFLKVRLMPRVTISMSDNGTLLAASVPLPDNEGGWRDDSGATIIWNPVGEVVRRFEGQASSLCFSPNASLLAIGYDNGKIEVISLGTGTILSTLHQSQNRIQSLDFAIDPVRDGDSTRWLLAAGDAGGTVTIWDVSAGQFRSQCRGSYYDVHAVKFSPDGMTLASGGRSPVRLWDSRTGRQLLEIRGTDDHVTGLSFSPDGRRLAVSCGHQVTMWSLEPGRGMAVLSGMSSQVVKTCLSVDGSLLVAQAQNWEIGVYDMNPFRLRFILSGPRGFTADNSARALSRDNKLLATSSGTEAQIFKTEDGTLATSYRLPPGLDDQLAYSLEGKLVSIRMECQDGKTWPLSNAPPDKFPRVLRIRDFLGDDPAQPLHEITRFNWHVFCGMIHPEGKFFVADGLHRGPDGDAQEIIAFDVTTGESIWQHEREAKRASSFLVIDPTGTTLSYNSDLGGGSNQVRLPSGEPCGKTLGAAFALSYAGTHYLAHGEEVFEGEDSGIAFYRNADARPLAILGIDFLPQYNSPRFSHDGRWLVFGTTEGAVVVCDIPEVTRRMHELGFPGLE